MRKRSILTATTQLRWKQIDVRSLVEDVACSLSRQIAAHSIKTELDISTGLSVVADKKLLWQAVRQIMLNAVEAMPQGGELLVTGGSDGRMLFLEIADSGPGLTAEMRQKAFDADCSTKTESVGMDLSIARRIAQAHGGEIAAANCPQGGAALTLTIPQMQNVRAAA